MAVRWGSQYGETAIGWTITLGSFGLESGGVLLPGPLRAPPKACALGLSRTKVRPHYAAKRTSCAKLSFAFTKIGC
jgi:hypothetical protein